SAVPHAVEPSRFDRVHPRCAPQPEQLTPRLRYFAFRPPTAGPRTIAREPVAGRVRFIDRPNEGFGFGGRRRNMGLESPNVRVFGEVKETGHDVMLKTAVTG